MKVKTTTLLLLITLLFQPLTFAQTPSPVCGNGNYFLANVDSVKDLLDTLKISQQQGQKASLPKERVQCGLPGEPWNICEKCTEKRDDSAFRKVAPILAEARHRDWHVNWHRIRREFAADGIQSQSPDKATVQKWQKQGHIPENAEAFERDHKMNGPLAGEDFFYMHRQMIKMLQIEMTNLGDACIAPWDQLPASINDPEWPVPLTKTVKDAATIKDTKNALLDLTEDGNKLLDPAYLKTVTLAELGNKVQAQLHDKLHTLYNDPKSGCKDANTDNSIECSDLTHDRTSHVNIYFWKLHGYIDNFVGAWLKANKDKYDTISDKCKETKNPDRCYSWKGTWLGKLPSPN